MKNRTITAQQAYLGSITAMSMADALLSAGDFRGPCGSRTKHSIGVKENAKEMADYISAKIADQSEISQSDIDCLQSFNKQAKTGLDPFSQWANPEYRQNKAVLLSEVRRLRNDARKLMALALSLSAGNTAGFISIALSGPIPQDYKEWAEGLAAGTSR